jgi:hypothetical protein
MKTFQYLLCLTLAVFSVNAFAHSSGHGDPVPVADCKKLNDCSKDEVTKGGLDVISKLVENAKIDKSWKDVKTASSAKLDDGTWIIAYNNPSEPDKTKQTFYLYVSRDGFLQGASFKK